MDAPATTMLYKAPGPHDIHGGKFDYIVVPDKEIDTKLREGWFLTTTAAADDLKARETAEAQPDTAPPTLEELRQRALQLGVKIDARWGAQRVQEAIAAHQRG